MDSQKRYTYDIDKVIFAIGHSSRDTYKTLYSKGVAMENKPFAIGVRIEHLRKDIDKNAIWRGCFKSTFRSCNL